MAEALGSSADSIEVPPPRWWRILLWLGCSGFLVVALVAVLFPLFAHGEGPGGHLDRGCMRNVKQLACASLIYARDFDEHLAPADQWVTALEPYLGQRHQPYQRQSAELTLRCPVASADSSAVNGYGYAFNAELGGQRLGELENPEDTAMIFDSILAGPNAASNLETLPDPPRHKRGTANNVAFANGSVRGIPQGTP